MKILSFLIHFNCEREYILMEDDGRALRIVTEGGSLGGLGGRGKGGGGGGDGGVRDR